MLRFARFAAGYATAVFAGVMAIWATIEISDAFTYGRLPLFILIFPGSIVTALRLTLDILPETLLLAAPIPLVGTYVFMRMGWNRWWHFALAGAASPLAGIILLQLASWGRFFRHNEASMALLLMPAGALSALLYWLIALRPSGVTAR